MVTNERHKNTKRTAAPARKQMQGVKNAELIKNPTHLAEIMDSMVEHTYTWIFDESVGWKETGFVFNEHGDGSYISVPSKNGRTSAIVAGVNDYVINLNNGMRFIVFSPEIKERVERQDFSWYNR